LNLHSSSNDKASIKLSLIYFFFLSIPPPPLSTLFPYTTLFRSFRGHRHRRLRAQHPHAGQGAGHPGGDRARPLPRHRARGQEGEDRKSTRLNSSHLVISYAVFCLKKKNK